MKQQWQWRLAACLVFSGLSLWAPGVLGIKTAAAQDQAGSGTTEPPKVLVTIREFLKTSTTPSQHARTEEAVAQSLRMGNMAHYFGMNSLTGQARSVFFLPYDSLADWQKDNEATQKNSGYEQAQGNDSALLESSNTTVWSYRKDMSLRAPVKIAHMRYVELTLFRIRPGHAQDFENAAKNYMSMMQGTASSHWAMYQSMYGASGQSYLVVTPMVSLGEMDQSQADERKAMTAASGDDMAKLTQLMQASIAESTSNIFEMDPRISNVPDAWAQQDPSFWGQK
jgi:hypothetical protein